MNTLRSFTASMDDQAGPQNSFRLQVGWARRFWCHCISRILGTMDDTEAMAKLSLAHGGEDDETNVQRSEDANLFFKLVVRCAAHRAWVCASWSELPPHNGAGFFTRTLLSPRLPWIQSTEMQCAWRRDFAVCEIMAIKIRRPHSCETNCCTAEMVHLVLRLCFVFGFQQSVFVIAVMP